MDGDEALKTLKPDQGTRLAGEPITALENLVASQRT
jgi:hypothetical protein